MTLNAYYFRALLFPINKIGSLIHRFSQRPLMAIIKGFASNAHDWQDYFFICIDSASVVEECIPMFRSSWILKGISVGYLLVFCLEGI